MPFPSKISAYSEETYLDDDIVVVSWQDKKYTMKFLRSTKEYCDHEIAVLQFIQSLGGHPSLPKLYHHFMDISRGELCVVLILTLFEGTSLEQIIPQLAPDRIVPLLRQLYQTTAFLHRHGISHRDLKAENVVYDPVTQHVGLIDFGMAQTKQENVFPFVRGTVSYWAPEYPIPPEYRGELANVLHPDWPLDIHMKADIFALGLLVYELDQQQIFLDKYPYDFDQVALLRQAKGVEPIDPSGDLVRNDHVTSLFPGNVHLLQIRNLNLLTIISQSLFGNPQLRPSADQILHYLSFAEPREKFLS